MNISQALKQKSRIIRDIQKEIPDYGKIEQIEKEKEQEEILDIWN